MSRMPISPFAMPAALLNGASQALAPRQPQWKANFYFDGVRYLARFDWPGVVQVFEVVTGELVARSKPGQPLEAVALPSSQASAQLHGRKE